MLLEVLIHSPHESVRLRMPHTLPCETLFAAMGAAQFIEKQGFDDEFGLADRVQELREALERILLNDQDLRRNALVDVLDWLDAHPDATMQERVLRYIQRSC